jgi:hypothetical protein
MEEAMMTKKRSAEKNVRDIRRAAQEKLRSKNR